MDTKDDVVNLSTCASGNGGGTVLLGVWLPATDVRSVIPKANLSVSNIFRIS